MKDMVNELVMLIKGSKDGGREKIHMKMKPKREDLDK